MFVKKEPHLCTNPSSNSIIHVTRFEAKYVGPIFTVVRLFFPSFYHKGKSEAFILDIIVQFLRALIANCNFLTTNGFFCRFWDATLTTEREVFPGSSLLLNQLVQGACPTSPLPNTPLQRLSHHQQSIHGVSQSCI